MVTRLINLNLWSRAPGSRLQLVKDTTRLMPRYSDLKHEMTGTFGKFIHLSM